MPPAASTLTELTRAECVELLENHSFLGRIAFVVEGRPVILPVNYLADRGTVVFRTAAGSKLSAARHGAEVAFEVDSSVPLEHSGWSVLVQGTASEITDAAELARLARGPLRSWAQHASGHWIQVSMDRISGRRLVGR